jgi:hypothetical protein
MRIKLIPEIFHQEHYFSYDSIRFEMKKNEVVVHFCSKGKDLGYLIPPNHLRDGDTLTITCLTGLMPIKVGE